MQNGGLAVGVKVREIVTNSGTHQNCTVLHCDAIVLAFEVERTVSEGGNVENVVSQFLVPWNSVQHVLVMEERT